MGDRIAVMNHGVLEQVGTPEELYERPANRFVAGFIGSPAMSFFDAAVASDGNGGARLRGDGVDVVLPRVDLPASVTVGVRPEHARRWDGRPPTSPARCAARVAFVEALGRETFLGVDVGGSRVVVFEEGRSTVGPGRLDRVRPGPVGPALLRARHRRSAVTPWRIYLDIGRLSGMVRNRRPSAPDRQRCSRHSRPTRRRGATATSWDSRWGCDPARCTRSWCGSPIASCWSRGGRPTRRRGARPATCTASRRPGWSTRPRTCAPPARRRREAGSGGRGWGVRHSRAVRLLRGAPGGPGRRARRTARAPDGRRRRSGQDARLRRRGAPRDPREWGRAMCAELARCPAGARGGASASAAHVRRASIRARVALTSRERGGGGLRAVIGAGVVGGRGARRLRRGPLSRDCARRRRARSPRSRSRRSCSPTARSRSRSRAGRGRASVAARRHGLVGGVVIGAAWLVVLSPPGPVKEWVLVPLLVALLGPGCVAALAARAGGDVTAGPAPRCGAGSSAACWCSRSG